VRSVRRDCEEIRPIHSYLPVLSAGFEVGSLFWLIECPANAVLVSRRRKAVPALLKQRSHMSQIAPTSTQPPLGHGPTVERRIATALWNQDERDRIIAMKAYELFCSRGCEHGSDLDDWLSAERELSSAADDVIVMQSQAGFDISIAERAQQERIFLSIAPSSLLVLWTGAGTNSSEGNTAFQGSTLSLASLPEPTDPAKVEVICRDGRVWVHLPYVGNASEQESP
jgi:hypothetical protein